MKYETHPGQHIQTAAQEMVELANKTGQQVTTDFNERVVTVNPGDTAEQVVTAFHKEFECRRAEYEKSPAGIEAAKRQEEYNKQCSKAELEGILPFSVKDQAGWDKAVASNSDGYGACCVRYAARWANYMEREQKAGKTIAQMAEACSHEADKEGITGFMYGCAVSMLAHAWEHGEALRLWHNKSSQLGTEGDKANENGGVLNPAILSVQ